MNDSEPLISVIIPVYNMELYLERCLDSVLNNTYRNLEVICIDDGSMDRSLEILLRYETNDPRIVVIAKENGGVSSARNAGLDRMTGEYVCFVDPDDYVHPQYVELLFLAVQNIATSISICGFQEADSNAPIAIPEMYSFDSALVQTCTIVQVFKTRNLRSYIWGKLFRSELINTHRFCEDMHLVEDTVFFAEVCEQEKTLSLSFTPYSLYTYCQRDGSAVKNATTPQHLKFAVIWNQMLLSSNRDDIYLDKALEWSLSIRYVTTYILPDREAVHECNLRLAELRPFLRRTRIYKSLYILAFLVFIRFPRIYWLYRVVKDPSMWKWERIERKKRRSERKSL